jgi:hypothetical protein
VKVLVGNGDGSFQAAISFSTPSPPRGVAVTDFDGDGRLDIATTHDQHNSVSVLVGRGDGTFEAAPPMSVGLYPVALTAGDFSGDGIGDLAVANVSGRSISILLGSASAAGYCFTGFLEPVGGSVESSNGGSFSDPLKAFKLGSTIPVKFSISTAIGSSCGAEVTTGVHTLQAIKWSSAIDSDAPIDATPTDAATTGNQFTLTGTEWHYNLSTKGSGFSVGTWQLRATLQDGTVKTVWITIKK